jgi:hypothetical protein
VLGILGAALVAHLGTILYGRIGKMIFLSPFKLIAKLTPTRKDDKLVEIAQQDLGIPSDTEEK